MASGAPEFSHTTVIIAPPASVTEAFFDANALAIWWQVKRSVCVPRPLGSYALEWEPTEWRDELLGRLGGALHATVVEFKPGRDIFLGDTYWFPPDGEPIGPMAIEVTCTPHPWGSQLHVRQSGYEESVRWRRYYEVVIPGWKRALDGLRAFLERR